MPFGCTGELIMTSYHQGLTVYNGDNRVYI